VILLAIFSGDQCCDRFRRDSALHRTERLEVSVNNGTGADVDPSADDPAIRAAGIAYLEKLMRQMDGTYR